MSAPRLPHAVQMNRFSMSTAECHPASDHRSSDIVTAPIVLTKDQEPAHTFGAEFGESDFLRAAG